MDMDSPHTNTLYYFPNQCGVLYNISYNCSLKSNNTLSRNWKLLMYSLY